MAYSAHNPHTQGGILHTWRCVVAPEANAYVRTDSVLRTCGRATAGRGTCCVPSGDAKPGVCSVAVWAAVLERSPNLE